MRNILKFKLQNHYFLIRMLPKLFFIISVNIKSLSNCLKFDKLEAFVHNLNPKSYIIAVTET